MWRTIGMAIAGFSMATPSWADVIEISRAGVVTVHDKPAIVTEDGAQPIAPEDASPVIAVGAGGRAPREIARALGGAGDEVAISPLLLEAIAWTESRFNTRAVSPRGAQGLMQLMPATAAELGVDPSQPEANTRGGARYLRRMLEEFDGNLELAIAAYNAGPAAVRRYNGVPPFKETRAYVASVMGYMAARADEEPSP
jgi:soluble lytic murein transglycosylase-like protein